jgi:hypothetical protein
LVEGGGGFCEGEVQLAKGNYYLNKGEENGKERKNMLKSGRENKM